MSAQVRAELTAEEEVIAAEFERGWSPEQIASATLRLGPAAADVLPGYLAELLHQRAQDEGVSEISVLRRAAESYLVPA